MTVNGKNGAVMALPAPEVLPEPPKRSYTTLSGEVLELRPVSAVLIRMIQRDQTGKPKVPIVEIEIGPQRKKVKEPNPDDPEYVKALGEWEEALNERALI